MITICHTRAEGTLVDGTTRGDGSAPILKSHRFRWSRYLGRWYLPHSRDQGAKRWDIEQVAEALRAAGFGVTVSIDETTTRSFAEAEAERRERAADRADRYADRAWRAGERSAASRQSVRQVAETIPFGQPILVGHHSEARHRKDLERIEAGMRRAINEAGRAHYWDRRACAADRYAQHRDDIGTTLRRLKQLQAERARIGRLLDGTQHREVYQDEDGAWRARATPAEGEYRTRLEADAAQLDGEIAYWRAHVARAEADGVKLWGPDDFQPGDYTRCDGKWWQVIRVNKKSLTVPAIIGGATLKIVSTENSLYSWTDRIPYDRVHGRMSADEAQAFNERGDSNPHRYPWSCGDPLVPPKR